LWIAEARQRLSPVIPLPILSAFLASDATAVLDQTRTLRASQNLPLERRQCLHGHEVSSSRVVRNQYCILFLLVGEGLDPLFALYRSELLWFTREPSKAAPRHLPRITATVRSYEPTSLLLPQCQWRSICSLRLGGSPTHHWGSIYAGEERPHVRYWSADNTQCDRC
jgi:hypothetical protein